MEKFLKELREIDTINNDEAGKFLYDKMYDLIISNDIKSITFIINEISNYKYSVFVKISCLRITNPYKLSLSEYRIKLFNSLKNALTEQELNHFSDLFL